MVLSIILFLFLKITIDEKGFSPFFICSYLTSAQSSKQVRDSVIKYKTTNPTLAVKFGLEYDIITANSKPDKEKQNTYTLLGEILIEMGLYVSALNYLNNSIQIYTTLPKWVL